METKSSSLPLPKKYTLKKNETNQDTVDLVNEEIDSLLVSGSTPKREILNGDKNELKKGDEKSYELYFRGKQYVLKYLWLFLATCVAFIGVLTYVSLNFGLVTEQSSNILSEFSLNLFDGRSSKLTLSDIINKNSKPNMYIIGGQPVKKSHPYMAGLSYSGFVGCGGTLVSPSVVLSAAHCDINMFGIDVTPTSVIINCKSRFYDPEEPGCERIAVKTLYKHPKYNRNEIKYDVMVVVLKRPAKAKPISLLSHAFKGNNTATAIGYGKQSRGAPSLSLKEAKLRITDRAQCNKKYRQAVAALYRLPLEAIKKEVIDDSMVCSKGLTGKVSNGDSGGPLLKVCDSDNIYQGGITSFGLSAIYSSLPDVFTNVANKNILDFLKAQVRRQGEYLSVGYC